MRAEIWRSPRGTRVLVTIGSEEHSITVESARHWHAELTRCLAELEPGAATNPLWTADGTPTSKMPDCPRCGDDELGARFDRTWCHACSWRGSRTALLQLLNPPAPPAERRTT